MSLCLLVLAGCGGGGGSQEVKEKLTLVNPPAPAQPREETRPFRLSATAVQMRPLEERPFRNTHAEFSPNSVAEAVDVLTVVMDYLGVPFQEFAESSELPDTHPWVLEMMDLKETLQSTGRPLNLQLGLARRSAVGRATIEDGKLKVDLTWSPPCFDFTSPEAAAVGDAYVNYARWLARVFQPAYIVNFSEANIYFAECGGAGPSWNRLAAIQRRAHNAIKEESPDTVAFASFHLETLYNDRLNGWNEEQYQAMRKMSYDTFAVAAYPFGLRKEDGSFVTPYDLPEDYFTRVRKRHPDEKRLSIAETGWNSVSIAVGDQNDCLENFPYSELSFPLAYLEFILKNAYFEEFDLVTWFSFRDAIPSHVLGTCYVSNEGGDPENDACQEDFWCKAINAAKENAIVSDVPGLFSEVVQKAFGAMGLVGWDGEEKSVLLERWREEIAKPIE